MFKQRILNSNNDMECSKANSVLCNSDKRWINIRASSSLFAFDVPSFTLASWVIAEFLVHSILVDMLHSFRRRSRLASQWMQKFVVEHDWRPNIV
jgi:hypothetical protein